LNYKRISKASIISVIIFSGIFLIMKTGLTTGSLADTADKRIVVYYFHGEFRCHTCIQIEKLTRKAVTEGFKKEMAVSKIELKIINIDKPENKHYVQDYNLETKSLIISQFIGTKQIRWKILPKIWDYYDKENVFIKYVRDEVNGYL